MSAREPTSERSLFLALDQGGSSSRAIAFDRRGRALASGARAVSERRDGTDRVEQDPEELTRSLHDAIEACVAALGERGPDLACAGLATQRSSLVCWDGVSGAALSPVISWQDRRAAQWLEQFAPDAADVRARTGLRLSPHYGASKMRWCLDHLPEVWRARDAERLVIGPLSTFLAFRLSAERLRVVDPANASRTLLWNVDTGDWDPVLCDRFGVPLAVLPRCVPTRYAFGTLDACGRALPLELSTGDQSAAAFASGWPRADTAYVNVGTGAFVQRPFDGESPELPRLLHSVLLREGGRSTSAIEGTINGAGAALTWIGTELGLVDVERHLDRWLASDREPPLFLNGVSGLAAPFWAPKFRSRFIGESGPEERVVAVAESIAFLVHAILLEMETALPAPVRIQISGGLARVDGLCQRIADLARVFVDRSEEHEATARGLARLWARNFGADDGELRVQTFAPRRNYALTGRYARWCDELARELAHSSG